MQQSWEWSLQHALVLNGVGLAGADSNHGKVLKLRYAADFDGKSLKHDFAVQPKGSFCSQGKWREIENWMWSRICDVQQNRVVGRLMGREGIEEAVY